MHMSIIFKYIELEYKLQIAVNVIISGPYFVSLVELFKRTTNSFPRGQMA